MKVASRSLLIEYHPNTPALSWFARMILFINSLERSEKPSSFLKALMTVLPLKVSCRYDKKGDHETASIL